MTTSRRLLKSIEPHAGESIQSLAIRLPLLPASIFAALATGDTAARRAAAAYADNADRLLVYLLRHLADEEDLVVPGILEHTERKITA